MSTSIIGYMMPFPCLNADDRHTGSVLRDIAIVVSIYSAKNSSW